MLCCCACLRAQPWEPTNFINQERLWKAEAKRDFDAKAIMELKKEREKEREIERIREMNFQNGLVTVSKTGPESKPLFEADEWFLRRPSWPVRNGVRHCVLGLRRLRALLRFWVGEYLSSRRQ